jgi:hypothetical protein
MKLVQLRGVGAVSGLAPSLVEFLLAGGRARKGDHQSIPPPAFLGAQGLSHADPRGRYAALGPRVQDRGAATRR